jgi:hypothetical protein
MSPPSVRKLFLAVRKGIVVPGRRGHAQWLKRVQIARCARADREHEESERQYMHVGHRFACICYAGATEDLGLNWKLGLILHEIGHLAIGGPALVVDHTEEDANEGAFLVSGVRVHFRGPNTLEWSRPPRWLKENL